MKKSQHNLVSATERSSAGEMEARSSGRRSPKARLRIKASGIDESPKMIQPNCVVAPTVGGAVAKDFKKLFGDMFLKIDGKKIKMDNVRVEFTKPPEDLSQAASKPSDDIAAPWCADMMKATLADVAKQFDGEKNTEEMRKRIADKMQESADRVLRDAMYGDPYNPYRRGEHGKSFEMMGKVLDAVTYKPGWRFRLDDVGPYIGRVPRGVIGFFRISYHVPDSRFGNQARQSTDIQGNYHIEERHARNPDAFLAFIRDCIRKSEEHESAEFFQVNGQMYQDPHAYDYDFARAGQLPEPRRFDEMASRRPSHKARLDHFDQIQIGKLPPMKFIMDEMEGLDHIPDYFGLKGKK